MESVHGLFVTNGINGSFGSPEKQFGINFNKAKTIIYITSIAIVICFSMEKKSFKFRGNNRNVNFCNSIVLLILEKYLEIKICMIFE